MAEYEGFVLDLYPYVSRGPYFSKAILPKGVIKLDAESSEPFNIPNHLIRKDYKITTVALGDSRIDLFIPNDLPISFIHIINQMAGEQFRMICDEMIERIMVHFSPEFRPVIADTFIQVLRDVGERNKKRMDEEIKRREEKT